jgi:hypothetical protein
MAKHPAQMSLFAPPPTLRRDEAVGQLSALIGDDLRALSDRFGLTRAGLSPLNKGWAGLTVERLLGLAQNNDQGPDFGDWELKVIPLRRVKRSAQVEWGLKGPLALTQCQLKQLSAQSFEESLLWRKIQRLLIVARLYHGPEEERSELFGLAPFDIEGALRSELEREYEEMRWSLRSQGLIALKEYQGRLLSLQDQGEQSGWSFYAKRPFVAQTLTGLITSRPPL